MLKFNIVLVAVVLWIIWGACYGVELLERGGSDEVWWRIALLFTVLLAGVAAIIAAGIWWPN